MAAILLLVWTLGFLITVLIEGATTFTVGKYLLILPVIICAISGYKWAHHLNIAFYTISVVICLLSGIKYFFEKNAVGYIAGSVVLVFGAIDLAILMYLIHNENLKEFFKEKAQIKNSNQALKAQPSAARTPQSGAP